MGGRNKRTLQFDLLLTRLPEQHKPPLQDVIQELPELNDDPLQPFSPDEQRQLLIGFSTVAPGASSPQLGAAVSVSVLDSDPSKSPRSPTNRRTKATTRAMTQANISGMITLTPQKFNTLRATITASTEVSTSERKTPKSLNQPPTEEVGATILNFFLALAPRLHSKYARYDEVDDATLRHFENEVVPGAPPLADHEASLFASSLLYDSSDFKRIPNTIQEPAEYFERKISGNVSGGKIVLRVDAPASRVFSWLWRVDTYERLIQHHDDEGLAALHETIIIPNSHSMIYSFLITLGFGLDDRVMSTWFAWKRADHGGFLLAFAPTSECPAKQYVDAMDSTIREDEKACKAEKGELRGLWDIEFLAQRVCKVTLVMQGKIGGKIPLSLLNSRVKTSLGLANRIRDKYERKGEDVDKEVRAAFRYPPAVSELNPERRAFIADCLALETDSNAGSEPWKTLSSPSPLVTMRSKYVRTETGNLISGERVVIGQAVTILDCPPCQALAWLQDVCGRGRTRRSMEERNPARVIIRANDPHDVVYSFIKRMPFPFVSREVVCRQLCALDDCGTGDLLCAFQPEESIEVDYGVEMKTVFARCTGITRLRAINDSQCELACYQHLDAGGLLPPALANKQTSVALRPIVELRNVFQRDDEVDEAERNELARVMKHDAQDFSDEEAALVSGVQDNLGRIAASEFRELNSPDRFVNMSLHFTEGESCGVMRATTVLDAPIEECAANEMSMQSRANSKEMADYGGLERSLTKRNNHSAVFKAVYDFKIIAFLPREFLLCVMWRKLDENTIVVVSDNADLPDQFPINPKYVRAATTAYWKYERLPNDGAVEQTKVTWVQQADLKGFAPKAVVNSGVVGQLMYLSKIRKRFDRSAAIDLASRARIVETIKNDAEVYSEEENIILIEGLGHFVLFSGTKAKELRMPLPTMTAKIALGKGEHTAMWGYTVSIVRASPEEILSLMWDSLSREKRKHDDLEKAIDDKPNGHNQLVYSRKLTPKITANRDFLGRCIWRREPDGSFVYTTRPEESDLRHPLHGVVRGKYPSTVKIKRLNSKDTRVEYVINPNAGGKLPSWLTNRWMKSALMKTFEIQFFFQSLRGLEDYDARDGEAVGEIMLVEMEADSHPEKGKTKSDARVKGMFERHKGLKEIGSKYPFFEGMMKRVVENKLRPAVDVGTKLCNVSGREGVKMGAGLSIAMAGNLTSEAAVDEWILKYPALRELDREELWFRPMMKAVAKKLLSEAPWGLKFRMFLGVFLSITDMVSDVNVSVAYLGTPGMEWYGWLLLGMVGLNMILQIVHVTVQNWKHKNKLPREYLIVLLCLKQGFEAYNIIHGREQEEFHVMDAKTELVATRGIEMFTEAIPGSIVQILAILQVYLGGKDIPNRALVSVVVSALTTGYTSSTIR
jgi:hypothetical protein